MTVSRSPSRKKPKTKTKPEPCPKCGQIECFKRTRYFPGQLLTNHDLETDQRYFIEKNKLHNRYLVGSGVVCGLAVRCGKCDGTIIVEPGYAIDCCGNDIVLCDGAEFDVVEYLEACRRAVDPDCHSKIPPQRFRCDDEPQEYCLILSYTETLAEPVTAFTRQNGCTPNRCEPSRICEGYRLDLAKKDELEEQISPPSIWDKFAECAREILPRWQEFASEAAAIEAQLAESNNQNLSAYHTAAFRLICRMKDFILDLYQRHPKVRCSLPDEVRDIEASFPALPQNSSDLATQNEYLRQARETAFRMGILVIQFYIDCICDALLTPCVECHEDGVLLACLTVCDGKIKKICNIVRKPVLTGPTLQYWLQPLYDALGDFLEALCCEFEIPIPQRDPRPQGIGVALNRISSLSSLARDIPTASVTNLSNFALSQIRQPTDAVAAVDFYNKPVANVRENLSSRNIRFVERQAGSNAEAYDLRMITNMSWDAISAGEEVELITSPEGLVTGIRRVGGPES